MTSRYTKRDLDAVSDNPEITPERMKEARPFAEIFPDLDAGIKRGRGRPRKADAKSAVTIRIDPDRLARWKASGDDWHARMVEILETHAPGK